jgi:hypothetical protein
VRWRVRADVERPWRAFVVGRARHHLCSINYGQGGESQREKGKEVRERHLGSREWQNKRRGKVYESTGEVLLAKAQVPEPRECEIWMSVAEQRSLL